MLMLAISPSLGVIHCCLRQQTITRVTFQEYLNELIAKAANMLTEEERCTIVFDGARPHLRMAVPDAFASRFALRILPPYSPMLNPTEQAHSCFSGCVNVKNECGKSNEKCYNTKHVRATCIICTSFSKGSLYSLLFRHIIKSLSRLSTRIQHLLMLMLSFKVLDFRQRFSNFDEGHIMNMR